MTTNGQLRCVLFRTSASSPEWVDVVWNDDNMLDAISTLLNCAACENFHIKGDLGVLVDESGLLDPNSLPVNENFSNFSSAAPQKNKFRGDVLLIAETDYLVFRDVEQAELDCLSSSVTKE